MAVAEALVNRYIVELVEAELPLGFLFPGAEMIHTEPDVASCRLIAAATRDDRLTDQALARRRTGLRGERDARPRSAPVRDRSPRAAHAERPGLHVPVRHEALLDRPRDGLLEHPLDAAQQVHLVHAHERDRLAGQARPAGPADAMDVVLRVPRELEVDDDRQVLDVEPAGSDVGRDQDADLAGLEALERARPFGLRSVRVDGDGIDALAIEPRRQP